MIRRGTVIAMMLCAFAPASAHADGACLFAEAEPAVVGHPVAARAIGCLVNELRAERGLAPMRWNPRLAASARTHATRMVRDGFFSHVGPDGERLADRVRAAGWAPQRRRWRAGENIAFGEAEKSRPAFIVAQWMRSSRHRAILLSRHREAGVGVVPGVPLPPGGPGATFVLHTGTRAR